MKADLVACAKNVIRDSVTNGVSLIHLMQQIVPLGLPIIISELYFIAILTKDGQNDPGDSAVVKIEVFLNENLLNMAQPTVNFGGPGIVGTRLITEIRGIPVVEAGNLRFVLSYEGRPLGDWTILIDSPQNFRAPDIEVPQSRPVVQQAEIA